MRLLEYQAKELFKEFGIRTPESISSTDIEKGRNDAKKLGYPFVIKAQVPVGGRGKAGGIQKCSNDDEFEIKYPQILNMSIKGEKTRAILLEKMAFIEKELYLFEKNVTYLFEQISHQFIYLSIYYLQYISWSWLGSNFDKFLIVLL